MIKTNDKNEISQAVNVWNEPVEWVGKKELLPALHDKATILLILSPAPCVYQINVIESLNQHHLKWRLAFSSPSDAATMAAVRNLRHPRQYDSQLFG